MQIAGIIAEYDPFHNGHAAHIAATRAGGATHIVAVMSGSFTQRGEPSALSKWDRTRMALAGGADLVLELPLPCAIASAETFAAGGVAILRALGCVDTLSFGSECGDTEALSSLAAADSIPEYRDALHAALDTGASYAAARQAAADAVFGEERAALLAQPNNTLGIEYIRAAKRQNAAFSFFTLPRVGAAHGDTPEGNIASAGWLREQMRLGDTPVTPYVPQSVADVLDQAVAAGRAPGDPCRLHTALLARLRTMTPDEIGLLPYLSEGLENRLAHAIATADSYDALMEALQTRRYPAARLRRLLWAALLGMTADTPTAPPYIRILGMNERGREILSAARPALPLLSKATQIRDLSVTAQEVFALECRASDLHALTMPKPLPCGTDFTTKCITT